jgi:DNA-binding response OmpR family regulator
MTASKPRVLVVEDDPLIAMHLEQFLRELGCECVGPVLDLPGALNQARHGSFEGAILDLLLGGDNAHSMAEALAGRGIPFGFASGVSSDHLDAQWKGRPYLGKPFGLEEMRQFLTVLLSNTDRNWKKASKPGLSHSLIGTTGGTTSEHDVPTNPDQYS